MKEIVSRSPLPYGPTFIETIATYSDSQELREKKETHWLFLSNDISGSASSSLLGTDVRNPYWKWKRNLRLWYKLLSSLFQEAILINKSLQDLWDLFSGSRCISRPIYEVKRGLLDWGKGKIIRFIGAITVNEYKRQLRYIDYRKDKRYKGWMTSRVKRVSI